MAKETPALGVSGKVDVVVKWGGEEGTTVSVGASAEAHDDNGNYVEARGEQSSSGEGSVTVTAGRKEE